MKKCYFGCQTKYSNRKKIDGVIHNKTLETLASNRCFKNKHNEEKQGHSCIFKQFDSKFFEFLIFPEYQCQRFVLLLKLPTDEEQEM